MIIQADILQWAEEYDGEPFHALLCDPPYHLAEIVKRFGGADSAPAQYGRDGAFQRASRGFMGKQWDGGDVAFRPETWAALARHLHPGAFGMAFASTKGYHRMACAIEDAGLIIHPMLVYAFGSGFPKATRIDTQVDRRAGAARRVVGQKKHQPKFDAAGHGYREKDNGFNSKDRESFDVTAPATEMAQAWGGHRYGGQVLKPAFEPVCVFSKPLNVNRFSAIISQISVLLEGLTCILLPAPDAEPITNRLHRDLRAAVDNIAHQNADVWVSLERVRIAGDPSASSLATLTLRSFVAGPAPTPDAISQLVRTILGGQVEPLSVKDTATSGEMVAISESIAWSWSRCLDVLSNPQNMFTTETEEHLIIDLKISRSLIEQSIHAATMPPSSQPGLLSLVRTVAMSLQSLTVKLPLLNGIIATETAIAPLAEMATDQAENPQESNLRPIVVFQKPYQGRPVDCITRTGAGALWVDGGRIDTGERWARSNKPGQNGAFNASGGSVESGAGRWPANLLLQHTPQCRPVGSRRVRGSRKPTPYPSGDTTPYDIYGDYSERSQVQHADADGMETVAAWQCAEGCPVAALDAQSGVTKNGGPNADIEYRHDNPVDFVRGLESRTSGTRYAGDSGGASRFFHQADWSHEIEERIATADPVRYCAKASKAEREGGLDPIQIKLLGMMDVFDETTVDDGRQTSIDNPYLRGETKRRNTHPTIKPIGLTRYLATLLLPPDHYAPRRILVPFAGAGSEAIGAMLAGWEEAVGVELEAQHVAIASARMAFWRALRYRLLDPNADLGVSLGDDEGGQLSLWETA